MPCHTPFHVAALASVQERVTVVAVPNRVQRKPEIRATLLSIALWVMATIAVIGVARRETHGRCHPGATAWDLMALAALSVGVAMGFTVWKRVRPVRAICLGIALGVGVGACLYLLGVFSWVHDCAN